MKKDHIVKDLTVLMPNNVPTKLKITNDKEYDKVVEIFKVMKDRQKVIADKKSSILKPMNASIAAVRDLFRPFEEKVDACLEVTKRGIESFLNEREQAKLELTEGVNNDKRLKNPSKIQDKLETIEEDFGRKKGTRSHKVPSIIDAALIPDEYWVLDMTLIAKDLKEGKEIPGVILESKIIITNT